MIIQEIRDLFAAHALQGLIARDAQGNPMQYAEGAYMYANAMLIERERQLIDNE